MTAAPLVDASPELEAAGGVVAVGAGASRGSFTGVTAGSALSSGAVSSALSGAPSGADEGAGAISIDGAAATSN